MAKYDILLISNDDKTIKRIQEISGDFLFNYEQVNDVDSAMDNFEKYNDVVMVILDAKQVKEPDKIIGQVQVARQLSPDAFILTVVGGKIPADDVVFLKKSGANMVMFDEDFLSTSRLEFISAQKIRASYSPVKISELVMGKTYDFSLYHLLPVNKKFLPVVHKGAELTESKYNKIKEVGEVYIKRDDAPLYKKFIEENTDRSAAGLLSRCRAQFLALSVSFTDLVLLILDQSEYASFDKGKKLYEQVSQLADDLITNLGAVGDAWGVVNNSAVGEFGSVERAPAIAAYTGLLSLETGIGTQGDVMIASMLCDIGMLDLPPKITKKIREGKEKEFNEEEMQLFRVHPIRSLNNCLSRKLPIPENLKTIIQSTHERVDKKGFPNQPMPNKIPEESMLIQFCEMLDRATLIRMGQQRVELQAAKKEIFEREYKTGDCFSLVFLEKIRKQLG